MNTSHGMNDTMHLNNLNLTQELKPTVPITVEEMLNRTAA